MNVENRLQDVISLRREICQEFLSLIIGSGWQSILYNKAKQQINNNDHKDNYFPIFDSMREHGINNYTVKDMDTSKISTVVLYCEKDLSLSIKKQTKNAFRNLVVDRDANCHLSGNETLEDLYLRIIVDLHDLREFVRAVDKYETLSISDSSRTDFRQKYVRKINKLQETFDEERIILLEQRMSRKKDIQSILDSCNPSGRLNDLLDSKYKICGTEFFGYEYPNYVSFLVEAAEAGIVDTYSKAAKIFYDRKDYDKAEEYLRFLFNEKKYDPLEPLQIMDMMTLADIYFRKLCSRNFDGHYIINCLIEAGCSIEKSSDGNRYEYINNGQRIKTIEIPQ